MILKNYNILYSILVFLFFTKNISSNLQTIQENYQTTLASLLNLLESNLNNFNQENSQTTPAWVTQTMLSSSSRNLQFVLHNGKYCVAHKDSPCNPFYTLNENDHNLWIDDQGNLWGYDEFGNLFTLKNNLKNSTDCSCPLTNNTH